MGKVKGKKTEPPESTTVVIPPINMQTVEVGLTGEAPLVVSKFSAKAREAIMATQREGSRSRKGKKREAKDFEACFEQARHISEEGWDGVHAAAFRNAMVSACRLVGYHMTKAKLTVFVEPDGFDRDEGTPLVRIHGGKPQQHEAAVRNDSGVIDIRSRPMWRKWKIRLRLRWDADQFSLQDVMNLLHRVGCQVGIGEGRPDSKKSNGCGWGLFSVDKAA